MAYSLALLNMFSDSVACWRPAEKLLVSEWADKYAYLSPESSHEPGKWKTLPYQVEIMDAFVDPKVEKITWMKSARTGYTKLLNQIIGFHIHHDPKSILLVQPTVEDAQGYSKEELAPLLRDTPVLQGVVSEAKSRDSNNTILKKNYPGGFLSLVGANSARGFRRISVPIVLFDEVDGYPPTAGQEGDQIKLGSKRAEWFWDKKIAIGSTPTIKGISRVEASFEESDKRFYNVPCPFCGKMQTIEFFNIKWPKGEPEKAALECIECAQLIPHSKKRWMVERGKWIATAPFKGHAGFFLWAGYSYAPNASWGKIAQEFIECKNDQEKLKTFKNTTLGQTWEESGERPEWVHLKARCEPYAPMSVPAGTKMVTSGTDVQGNRLATSVYAWGTGEESWLLYHVEIVGDPMHEDVWLQHDQLMNRFWTGTDGLQHIICSAGIDASDGNTTQAVRNYCRSRGPKVFALKGASVRGKPVIGVPTKQDVTWQGEKIENGIELWPVGTDTAKSTLYARLALKEPGPGYVHFYIGVDDEYFKQLTAEKLVTRFIKGYPVKEWHNVRSNKRNEAIDCYVYAYSAAIRAGLAYMGSQVQPIRKPIINKETVDKRHSKQRRRW